VRDYLESIGWNKKPPAPHLPEEIIDKALAKYREVRDIFLGEQSKQ
jgi:phosphoribosylaminoimidazole-succinocarboxamide synthase